VPRRATSSPCPDRTGFRTETGADVSESDALRASVSQEATGLAPWSVTDDGKTKRWLTVRLSAAPAGRAEADRQEFGMEARGGGRTGEVQRGHCDIPRGKPRGFL